MAYQVLARKWRPMLFADVIGQEHITTTLVNAIKSNRIAHAYIFSGPRGVGKTTTARILAKALNCEQGPTPTPCNQCSNCLDITKGSSIDVLEIDGASNNGVDEVRNLRDKIRFTPSSGKYKIYIIDEVHMLTTQAFNALLKTLEEPPEHAIFVFATTEIHKVLPTILSRCQRYDFKSIPVKQIVSRLQYICKSENINVSNEALIEIAIKADGGMRDAQSLLDQVISFSGADIDITHVRKALGLIDRDVFFQASDYVAEGNSKALLSMMRQVSLDGFDLGELLIGLEEHLRNLLVTIITGNTDDLDIAEKYQKNYKERIEQFSQSDLLKYLQLVQDAQITIKRSFQPRLKLELLLIKMAQIPSSSTVEEILAIFNSKKKTVKKLSDLSPEKDKPQIEAQQKSDADPNKYVESDRNVQRVEQPPGKVQVPTMDDIKGIWKNLVKKYINLKKTFLANQMALGVPIDYRGNGIIEIGISREHKFALDHLQKNAKLLEKQFEDTLKRSVRIEVKLHEFEKEEKPQNIQTGAMRLEEINEHAPILQEVIDTFDCKVLRINQKNNGNT